MGWDERYINPGALPKGDRATVLDYRVNAERPQNETVDEMRVCTLSLNVFDMFDEHHPDVMMERHPVSHWDAEVYDALSDDLEEIDSVDDVEDRHFQSFGIARDRVIEGWGRFRSVRS